MTFNIFFNKQTFLPTSILLIAILLQNTAHAESTSQCNFVNIYDGIDCLEKENRQLVKRLNFIYSQVQRLDTSSSSYGITTQDYVEGFTASQKAWTNYVTKNCEMQSLTAIGLQGAGSGLVSKGCWNDAYHSRVNELQIWLNDVKESLSD